MEQTVSARPRTLWGRVLTCFGVAFVAITLICALLIAIPGFLGWQQMTVLTGSMYPEIPIGSMVYIEQTDPKNLTEGDVITFEDSKGETITHRVVNNRTVEGKITTKGDANEQEDIEAVSYSDVIGKVAFVAPGLGDIFAAMATPLGKVYLLAFGACGVMLVILGGRLRKKE